MRILSLVVTPGKIYCMYNAYQFELIMVGVAKQMSHNGVTETLCQIEIKLIVLV